MKTVIVYESMFGNTRRIAGAIAEGMGPEASVEVVGVNSERMDAIGDADLVIIGAPTHAHSLSTSSSREEAEEWAADPERNLQLDPQAHGRGVREWLDSQPPLPRLYAAFDTRADMIRLFTGAASTPIARVLGRRRMEAVVPAESFAVSMHNELARGEQDRAREWGQRIAEVAAQRHVGADNTEVDSTGAVSPGADTQ
ncbi:MAG: flavodoxin domain-containing protein [Microbacteriaceae bacterium]|nr:flavodoxin domain-containing protein [Microbacteriaceae bacterium]